MSHLELQWLVPLILLALVFDFMNGFHDSANSIATVVATRVLSPQFAVIWAACFNLLGPLLFEQHVAHTVGSGIIDIGIVTPRLVASALIGAIVWNIFTWYYGIPSSSSHALIGGLVGGGVYEGGLNAMVWKGILKTVAFIFLSPIIGMVLGSLTFLAIAWIFRRKTPYRVDSIFRKMQLVSSSLYSIGHGTNDAQKTMGIIFMLLVTGGVVAKGDPIPNWVILVCSGAIALGTAFGGWRIVKTMGIHITRLNPCGGFSAEVAGAVTLFGASTFGIPVSTTHTITGAIVGVGSANRYSAVRWRLARQIVWAWILTIPAAAAVAMLTELAVDLFRR
ncbi:MAG: inorganic phosphate transporter [Verrucomicrobiae bacterium]|nr:inorganic phosphate transporter [Verrucomicrobiae bacterium]